ncbi:sporulation protein [Peribacillus sp. SCS-37]|uniref:sporulation protein n=1 Tax=Paraperibacillus esterisolvens TaxID=3115296 RepID=UPI003905F608
MAFFNKVLASIGIGNSEVDTRLETDRYMPGDKVTGTVEIKGGSVEQKIDEIYLGVCTQYVKEVDDKKYTQKAVMLKHRLNDAFTIGAGEMKNIPFTFDLPEDVPLTYGKTKVWIETGLDIKNAVDPSDEDYIQIEPGPLVHSVLLGLTELGFRLRQAENKAGSRRHHGAEPFLQEFEFVPVSGKYHGRLDELEVTFLKSGQDAADLLIQVDRKARGLAGLFAEAMEMDETMVRSSVSRRDIPKMQETLDRIIERYA